MTIVLDSSLFLFAFRNHKLKWLAEWLKTGEDFSTCDIVVAEIKSGVLGVGKPETRARQMLWFQETFSVIPSRDLNRSLCDVASELCGSARRNGFSATIDDAFIGATAKELNAQVATANVKHFEQLGVEAFNPFLENQLEKRKDKAES